MRKGKHYEDLACEYLLSIGYRILERNYHCRFSEIDIIALEGDTLVIVEVKGAKNTTFGFPEERFSRKKLDRLQRCARVYMKERGIDADFRIELITILGKEIRHIKDIFF